MLSTIDGVRAAATRLLDASDGREAVGAFAEEYMRLDRIATQAKDPAFPEYTASLQAAMIRDLRETWEVVAFDDKASALNLFSTTKVVVNLDLAKLYGIDTTGLTATTYQVRSSTGGQPSHRYLEQGWVPFAVRQSKGRVSHLARQIHSRSR